MDVELLSRVQFALTASFHFIYPPLSMGLGLMLVVIGLIYVRTKDPKWRRLSFFWVKVYALIFAIGVATGVVQ
ncbi:MAG: cytochrome ubiquinol oxidase subunit I, partial [Chloroflexi bacterium]|nr:cytochrome ubiquinol oxidase subunit I [Chloroflexota bacterium]